MKIIKGDLLQLADDGAFDVIMHGCNCFNAMGKGIALSIKNRFPEAYAADCRTEKGDYNKLGTFSSVFVKNNIGDDLGIINAYTQYTYWDRSVPVLFEYDAFQKILDHFSEFRVPSERWGLPLIGCGLAGGNKERVLSMIEKTFDGMDVTVVEFDK